MSGQRPTFRRGLPYGWWKNRDVWAGGICLLCFTGMLAVIVLAYLYDWKIP